MALALYGDLADWYRLVDPPTDHEDEAAVYAEALRRAGPPAETLLELGCGGGHNALYLKRWFRCTLTDVSPAMLALSRELNPDCEHQLGDMRTLRLHRTFDAVLIHDAIAYLTSVDDLRAAITTAAVHARVGGTVLLAPDDVRETFREGTRLESASDGARTLHNLMWHWDPDPADDTCATEFVLTMREAGEVRVVHERHVTGLFSIATWTRLMKECGLEVVSVPRPVESEYASFVFLGIKRDA